MNRLCRISACKKTTVMITFAFVVLAVGLREIQIMALPIFSDEAIYILVSQNIWKTSDLFYPLEAAAARPLLFHWLLALAVPWSNYLLASRSLSAMASGFSAAAIWLIGAKLFGRKVGIASAVLYALSPLSLVWERNAAPESLMSMFALLAVLGSVSIIRQEGPARMTSILTGLSVTCAVLCSEEGLLFLALPVLCWFAFKKARSRDFLRAYASSGIVFVAFCVLSYVGAGSYLPYNTRDWHFFFQNLQPEQLRMGLSVVNLFRNMTTSYAWISGYLGFLLPMAILSSVLLFSIKRREVGFVLGWMVWSIAPITVLSAIYSRYFVVSQGAIVILAVVLIDRAVGTARRLASKSDETDLQGILLPASPSLRRTKITVAVSFLIMLVAAYPMLTLTGSVLADIKDAPIPQYDRGQLIESWPSGYGMVDAMSYLNAKARDGRILVLSDHIAPFALQLMPRTNPNVTVVLIPWIWTQPIPPLNQTKGIFGVEVSSIFVVFNQADQLDNPAPFLLINPCATLVGSFPRPGNQSLVLVYSVNSCGTGSQGEIPPLTGNLSVDVERRVGTSARHQMAEWKLFEKFGQQ